MSAIERSWTTRAGLKAMCVAAAGYRCGYVAVPKGHPLHGVKYSASPPQGLADQAMQSEIGNRGLIPCVLAASGHVRWDAVFDVHGGITFTDRFSKDEEDWWWGFDCAHLGDGRDPSLMSDSYRRAYDESALGLEDGPIRSEAYVVEQCEALAEQIVAVSGVMTTSKGGVS